MILFKPTKQYDFFKKKKNQASWWGWGEEGDYLPNYCYNSAKGIIINSIYKKQRVDQTYVGNNYLFVLLLQLSFCRKNHTRNFNQNQKYTFTCENTYGNIKHTTHNEKCPKRLHYLVTTYLEQLVHNFTIDI